MLNHIIIMGRLTRDPELRRIANGTAVASFTVAVDRDFGGKDGGEKETDFIDCVAWRQTGEFVSKYFTKGRMIVVAGRLQIRNWTDKEGNKRRAAEIVADSVYFGDSKNNSGNAPASNVQNNQTSSAPAPNNYGVPVYGAAAAAPAAGNGSIQGNAYMGGFNAPQSDYAILEDDDAHLPF